MLEPPSSARSKPRLTTLDPNSSGGISGRTTSPPERASERSGARKVRGRTVAIWGRHTGVLMVAMTLPPIAGRVWSSSPVSRSISSPVQSAVSPVSSSAARAGRVVRPDVVAGARTTSGPSCRRRWARTFTSASWLYMDRTGCSTVITRSAPLRRRTSGSSARPPERSIVVTVPPQESASSLAFPVSSKVTEWICPSRTSPRTKNCLPVIVRPP